MPELRNPRWEKFAQAYVLLGNASEALKRSGYKATTISTVTSDAHRLLTYADIKQRISELKAQKIFEGQVNRRELEGFFAAVIRTPSGEVTPNHPLCQSHEVSEKGVKVRMPDKVAAAQALARLNGYEAAAKVDITVNPLTDYLRALRNGEVRVLNNTSEQSDVVNVHSDDDQLPARDPCP